MRVWLQRCRCCAALFKKKNQKAEYASASTTAVDGLSEMTTQIATWNGPDISSGALYYVCTCTAASGHAFFSAPSEATASEKSTGHGDPLGNQREMRGADLLYTDEPRSEAVLDLEPHCCPGVLLPLAERQGSCRSGSL